jgi:hypothetical protein
MSAHTFSASLPARMMPSMTARTASESGLALGGRRFISGLPAHARHSNLTRIPHRTCPFDATTVLTRNRATILGRPGELQSIHSSQYAIWQQPPSIAEVAEAHLIRSRPLAMGSPLQNLWTCGLIPGASSVSQCSGLGTDALACDTRPWHGLQHFKQRF